MKPSDADGDVRYKNGKGQNARKDLTEANDAAHEINNGIGDKIGQHPPPEFRPAGTALEIGVVA